MELAPSEALQLAIGIARWGARWRMGNAPFDDDDDVAAIALLGLIEEGVLLCPAAIEASVLRASRVVTSRGRADRRLRERLLRASETEARSEHVAAADQPEAQPGPARRVFRDGTIAIASTEGCSVIALESLSVILPSGVELRGPDARRRAQEALLRERGAAGRAQQTSNARRAAAALRRDALLLSVAGLPWRDALDRLRAAGVTLSRDGLRSGLRAARLRCVGQPAHSRASARG